MRTKYDDIECICRADQTPGSYTLGCPRHMQMELDRGPSYWDRESEMTGFHTVTYFHAEVKVSTPILKDGEVWSEQTRLTCEHNHTDEAAAVRCGRRLIAAHKRSLR